MPNGFLDLAKGEEKQLSTNVEVGSLYSGAIFASTGCDAYTNACETGVCRNKHCELWAGAVGPHTRAEFTFDPKSVDFYDISLMHGVNVPMSMTPVGGTVRSGDAWSCGAAGSSNASNGLPKCSYGYNPVVNGKDYTTDILFVAAPDLNNLKTCSSDSQCSSGQRCGLAAGRDPTGLPTTEVPKVCGKEVGVWSSDEVCVYSDGRYSAAPFNCDKTIAHGTNTNLFGCSGAYIHSGYQNDNAPSDLVCGCTNWPNMPNTTTQCVTVNPEWVSLALPWVQVVKNMCPTAYSYAYDDMTSTFTCGGDGLSGYVVEFCPGGVELHRV
jgi:hypothetical protein